MARQNGRKSGQRGKREHLAKPAGLLAPRVQQVGPERFGIVGVDCAKARSQWMLTDFYGKVLVEPTSVTHDKPGLAGMVAKVRQAVAEQGLGDLVVAVERTGNYHRPVQRAWRAAGFETRIVHPFATKQFRLPADAGNKTDDTDLAAIPRATACGFGLRENRWDASSRRRQLLVRHRRDLVHQSARLRCQMREHLEQCLPGYAACFGSFFAHEVARTIAREFASAAALRDSGVNGLAQRLGELPVRFPRRTLEKAVAWAELAAEAEPQADLCHQFFRDLDDDWQAKPAKIRGREREIAALLVRTPYVLLRAIPGINVVSAGELAGEMGPIAYYANPNAITGRAGLFPSRYQSDQTDRADGPLVRRGNRRRRRALLQIADNLVSVNHYFRGAAARWRLRAVGEGRIRVRVASRFRRLAYAMVSGRRIVRHQCCRQPDYILDKRLSFHQEHGTPTAQVLADLDAATTQLPTASRVHETVPLAQKLDQINQGRRRGAQHLRALLVQVLAKLGGLSLPSTTSADQAPS